MNGNEISRLLEEYGTSLAETRALMPRLTEAIKRQRAIKPPAFLRRTELFTARQARGMGVELPGEDWLLKVALPVEGVEPSVSYITPERWEVLEDQGLISPEGKRYTREEYEAERAEAEREWALQEQLMQDPGYWERIREWEEIERVFGRVFITEDDAREAITLANQDPDAFLEALLEIGRTEDTELLLRKIARMSEPEVTEEEIDKYIDELFAETALMPPTIPPEGIAIPMEVEGEKVDALLKPDFSVWIGDTEVGAINPETGEFEQKELEWWQKYLVQPLLTAAQYTIIPAVETLHRLFGEIPSAAVWSLIESIPDYMQRFQESIKTGDFWKLPQGTKEWLRFGKPPVEGMVTPADFDSIKEVLSYMWDAYEKARGQYMAIEAPTWHTGWEKPKWLGGEELTLGVKGLTEALFEIPIWLLIPSATFLRARLAPTAAAGGTVGMTAQATRVALLPIAGLERAVATGLRYGVGLPVKYVSVDLPIRATRKAFEIALDRGLDKWLVRQGIRANNANRVVAYFLKVNHTWLYKTAQANLLKNMAKRKGAEAVAKAAAEDTVKQAEPLLLKAARDAGVDSATEGTSPAMTKALTTIAKRIDTEGLEIINATQLTRLISDIAPKVTLEKTESLMLQLRDMGYSLANIEAMTAEQAWANLFKKFPPEVKVKPVPEVKPPAVAEVERLAAELKAKLEAEAKPKITEAEEVSLRIDEMEAEVAGLKEWLAAEPATKLVSLIKKTGWSKGEVSNLTVAAYRKITGKTPSPTSLTKDKKHVKWEYALDDVATEMGYKSGEELKYAIEDTGKGLTRIKELEAELAVTEVPKPPEVKPVPIPKPPITEELKSLYSDIQTEVEAAQVAIKGLTGDEARIARETLKGLERELTYVRNTLDSFKKRPDLPEATVLRSTIMAWAKYKGLPKTELQKIFSEVAGRRQLRVIPQEQLVDILSKVKAARPKRIHGKTVVTPKTEKKIQTLKDTLIANKQLTEKSFNHLVEQLGLRATGYQSATKFITESEAKALIRAMNDEAVLAQWDIKVEESLARHPDIKEARDTLNARSIKEREVTFDEEPIKIKRGNELRSMRYYVLRLQKELNAPIYDIWQKINMTHLTMRQKQQQLYDRLEQSTLDFRVITDDETALRRVEDYIASKHKMGPKAPPDITAEEIKLAEKLEGQLFGFRNDVRYARFNEAYAGHSGDMDMIANDIPDAPKRALRRALDIFEGKGAEALRKFLDTQEWGVIKSGYNPLSVVKPKLHLYTAKPTTFAKGHIQTREGTEYTTEDRNILQRYRSYTKQIVGLTDLAPLMRAFDRVFTEHAHKLEDPRHVGNVLSRGLNEMKGYREDGGLFVHLIERIYAQVAATVFWRPDLVLRNKFQNWAFNPDFHQGLFMHPGNRFMSKERRAWFELFVTQNRGIIQDLLFQEQKPIKGFGRWTRLANKTSGFPWSDHSNRAECFFVRMNRVDRALGQYEKDGDLNKLINNSGMRDFEARQQAEALELLAMDSVDYGVEGMPAVTGKEAFARYNGQQLTNNVHFLYDRSQRAPAEMGATGKVLGNIFVFQRSWAERFLNQGNKLIDPKVPASEKFLALRIIVGIIVCGMLAGMAYQKITGKKYNPYNPLNILTYGPGGLMLGITEDISNVMYLITEAVQGDKSALGSLPGALTGVADLTLPFYKNLCQALESITDMKNIDAWALRKIREMIDEEYEIRGGIHEVERTLLEKLQHALLAGILEPPTPQEKVKSAEELLGSTIEEEDKPFSIEEPDIYDMRKFNSDLGRILGDIPPGDITEANDYSTLAIAWLAKEASEATWESHPSMPLYKINADPKEGDTFEEYYRQWQERKGIKEPKKLKEFDDLYPRAHLGNISRRQYDLLKQYHSLGKPEQVEFLEKHPDLKLNPRNEWLKENPTENARLAIWGQAKILTQEAYDEIQRLIKTLDIPDDAIPRFTLPPEGSVANYFKYLEAGEELGYNSWEVQLIIAKDDDLREFLERQPIETPIRSLELKVKHRELFDQYDGSGR